jgi:hypothetical protein
MLRLTPVFATVLALAVLSVLVAAPLVVAEEKTVNVTVTCRSGDRGGPGSVTIDPWLLWLRPGDDTTWNLGNGDSGDKKIVVEPKKDQRWPYEERKHEGLDGKAYARGMTAFPLGDFRYDIKFYCNGEEFVVDPRVRVGP